MSQNTADRYNQLHARTLSDPAGFWGEVAEEITWFKRWDKVLDDSNSPFTKWFKGGVLNTCYNAIDRHVEAGRGEQPAIIYDSPVTNTVATITYRELLDQVAGFAGALRHLGVEKGDRVIIYMPMIPQTLVAMLACARLGAVHSMVFGGFAPHELATRINDAKPRVVVSASCGIEPNRLVKYKSMVDAAIEESEHKPEHCIIFQRPQEKAALVPGRDIDWNDAVADAVPADCVPVNATDPLYILYTSGTTGRPKGSVRDNGGHAVALKWTMKNFLQCRAGRGVLGGLRRGLGGRPLLHRLRPTAARLHHGRLRGQARGHARRRHLLAGHRAAQGPHPLHRADRVPRDQARRPARGVHEEVRPLPLPRALPGRRALRPRHPAAGRKRI